MRAVQHSVHGGTEVLEVVEVPSPSCGPRDVVVAVRATALNRLDILQRIGPPLIPGFRFPHVAGLDVAGDVVEIGSDVDGLAKGDRVVVKPGIECGRCRGCRSGDDRLCTSVQVIGGSLPGGYAELCRVPATHAFLVPDDVGYDHAACVPTALSTAWRAIVETADVQSGEVVVIHGPGSGVSIAAVQLAKRAGATVVVTGRSEAKLQRIAKLGADHVVADDGLVPAAEQVRDITGGRGADVVFNHVGAALFDASVEMLAIGGRLVHCGTTTGSKVEIDLPSLYQKGIGILGVGPQSYAGFAAMLQRYWESGSPLAIDSSFHLVEAARAQERLDSGEVFGKVLLHP